MISGLSFPSLIILAIVNHASNALKLAVLCDTGKAVILKDNGKLHVAFDYVGPKDCDHLKDSFSICHYFYVKGEFFIPGRSSCDNKIESSSWTKHEEALHNFNYEMKRGVT